MKITSVIILALCVSLIASQTVESLLKTNLRKSQIDDYSCGTDLEIQCYDGFVQVFNDCSKALINGGGEFWADVKCVQDAYALRYCAQCVCKIARKNSYHITGCGK